MAKQKYGSTTSFKMKYYDGSGSPEQVYKATTRQSNLHQLVEEFGQFLRGCGYHFDGQLAIVPNDDDVMPTDDGCDDWGFSQGSDDAHTSGYKDADDGEVSSETDEASVVPGNNSGDLATDGEISQAIQAMIDKNATNEVSLPPGSKCE